MQLIASFLLEYVIIREKKNIRTRHVNYVGSSV